jgi:hypothetical protein
MIENEFNAPPTVNARGEPFEPLKRDLTPASGPGSALLLLAGGILAVLGAFLPWVTVFVFNINGVSARWGFLSLLAGLVGLAAGYQRWKGGLFKARSTRTVMICGLVAGFVALSTSLLVAVALKTDVAKSKTGGDTTSTTVASSDCETAPDPAACRQIANESFGSAFDDFSKSLEKAFAVRIGYGIWVTALGGLAMAVGSTMSLRGDSESAHDPGR